MTALDFIKSHFIAICWILLILVWVVTAFSTKPAKESQPRSSRLLALFFLFFVFLLLADRIDFYFLHIRILPGVPALLVAGDCLLLLGLVTAVWARFILGRNWSGTVTFKKDHELIEKGPYRFVRHPIYTGFLLMFVGTAIIAGNLGALIAVFISFLAIWRKLRQEETLLTKHFPDAYPRYMSRTKALIPFLL